MTKTKPRCRPRPRCPYIGTTVVRVPLYEEPGNRGLYLIRLADFGIEGTSLWHSALGEGYRPVICSELSDGILKVAASRRKTTPDQLRITSVELTRREPPTGMAFMLEANADSGWWRTSLKSRRRTGRGWVAFYDSGPVYGFVYRTLSRLSPLRRGFTHSPVYAVFHFEVRK